MTGDENRRGSILERLWANQRGQGIIEYALIIGIVSLGAVVSLGFFSGTIQDTFFSSGNTIANLGEPESGTQVRGSGPELVLGPCTINTYVYYRQGDVDDLNFLGPQHDGLPGFYTCVGFETSGPKPTHFTVGIWEFDCEWHGLFHQSGEGVHIYSGGSGLYFQGCYNLPPPPVNTSPPVISGDAALGGTLTTTNGGWNPAADSYDYVWERGTVNSLNCSSYTGPWTENNMGSNNSQNWNVPNSSTLLGKCVRVGVTAQDGIGQTGTPDPAWSVPYGPIQDTTPPSISASNFSTSPTNVNTLTFRLDGNEAINCATVAAGDFSLSSATFASASQFDTDTCAVTLTSTIAAGSSGTSSANDTGGTAIADSAGNNATSISNLPHNWTVDHQGPTLVGTRVTATPTADTTPTFTLTAGGETINCGSISSGDFALTGASSVSVSPGGNATTCNVTVNTNLGSGGGTATVAIAGAFSVTDQFGNASTTATGFPISWVIAPPTTFFGTRVTASPTNSATLVFTITGSRALQCGTLSSGDFELWSGSGFSVAGGTSTVCTITLNSNVSSGNTTTRTVDLDNDFEVTDVNGDPVDEDDETGGFSMSWVVDRDLNVDEDTITGTPHAGSSIQFRVDDQDSGGPGINCSTITTADFVFRVGGSSGTIFTPSSFSATSTGSPATCTVTFTTNAAGSGTTTQRTTWVGEASGFNVADLFGNTDDSANSLPFTWVRSS